MPKCGVFDHDELLRQRRKFYHIWGISGFGEYIVFQSHGESQCSHATIVIFSAFVHFVLFVSNQLAQLCIAAVTRTNIIVHET